MKNLIINQIVVFSVLYFGLTSGAFALDKTTKTQNTKSNKVKVVKVKTTKQEKIVNTTKTSNQANKSLKYPSKNLNLNNKQVVIKKENYNSFKSLQINNLMKTEGGKIVLTLNKAEKLALQNNLDLKAEALKITEAEIDKKIIKHKMYPVIKVEATALLWNEKQEFNIEFPDSLTNMLAQMGVNAAMDPIVIHDQFTTQASITIAQPITPLLSLRELYKLKISEIAARKAEQKMSKNKKIQEVRKTYINTLKISSYIDLLEEAERMLLKQKTRVQNLIAAQYATKADLSRIDSELAKIRAQKIQILTGISLSKQYLSFLMGMKPNANIKLSKPSMALDVLPVKKCYAEALQKRPVFKMLSEREKQLEYAKNASDWAKIPQVIAFGQYKRSDGFSEMMQPANVGMIGVSLKWEFNWKNKWREIDKLTLKQRTLELKKEQAKRGILLEIHKNFLAIKSSAALIEANLSVVKSFRKTYEKTVKLYQSQEATNTDVLAARTNLTKAEVKLLEEKYNYFFNKLKYLQSCGY